MHNYYACKNDSIRVESDLHVHVMVRPNMAHFTDSAA